MPFLELDVLNNQNQAILGIDLGTTNSLAAIWLDERPTVLRPPGSDDGRIPSDNPFVDNPDALKSIWTYGHRSVQGLEFNSQTRELWNTPNW